MRIARQLNILNLKRVRGRSPPDGLFRYQLLFLLITAPVVIVHVYLIQPLLLDPFWITLLGLNNNMLYHLKS